MIGDPRATMDPRFGAGAAVWGCPRCHAALTWEATSARCPQHGEVGVLAADGIHVFDRDDTYWGEIDRASMQRANAESRAAGWQSAVERIVRPQHPDLVDYVQHPARADWYTLLPLDRDRTIAVDVGCGWGANSFGLAPHVARVYACERVPERIEFVALRAAQDGAPVTPVRAELHALPFAPQSIDVFVVNGVLEWAGLVDPQAGPGRAPRDPRRLQQRFLAQLLHLLRPGGAIYVGIENRFGRMFLRGAADHLGLRYTSLMPKPLARAYHFVRAAASGRTHRIERDYRTWIYSFNGTAQLLRDSGFVAVQRWSAVPGYNVPMRLVPLETSAAATYLARRERSPHRLRGGARRALHTALARTGLEARIASCFALVARRPES
jgi:SAM-dependent methyltransferase